MSDAPAVDPARVIADLRELESRTSGPDGAQTGLLDRGVALGARAAGGAARRDRPRVRGRRGRQRLGLSRGRGRLCARRSALGSHLDSVPNGGWLDGPLGVMAALGVLRGWAQSGAQAPEDPGPGRLGRRGGRFGRSLLGSGAVAGTLDPAELEGATGPGGRPLAEALAENGVELARMPDAGSRLERVGRLHRAPHRAGAGAGRAGGLRGGGHRVRRAGAIRPSLHRAAPRTPARPRWTRAATRGSRPRPRRSGSRRSRPPRPAGSAPAGSWSSSPGRSP